MNYERVLAEVLATPWAITRDYLGIIAEVLSRRLAGTPFTEAEIAARVQAGQVRAATRGDGARVGTVAVMPILGVLMSRAEAMETSGAVSVQRLTAAFDRLVTDPSVAAIVLDFDSPGGSVGGVEEFADRVRDAGKPVVALANPMMASGAYWIASGALEIVASPSALAGSIGVFSAHADVSAALEKEGVKVSIMSAGRKKVYGNPFEPLSDEAREEIQGRVDMFYDQFVKSVARGRGVSTKAVREGFGEGGVVGAQEAVELRMADQVGTIEDAIALAAKRAGIKQAASAPTPAAVAEAPSAATTVDPADEVKDLRLRLAARGA